MKDEGKKMAATPTDEKLTGVTLLQLLFQLGGIVAATISA